MALIAKPVVKNKFWIVENDGEKIATIQKNSAGVTLVSNNQRQFFENLKKLGAEVNVVFDNTPPKPKIKKSFDINGYPTCCVPHNVLYDVKKRCFIYTKNKKSKSYHCAGFFLVKHNNAWVKSFCPKVIILQRQEFKGPYQSKEDLQKQYDAYNAD